MKALSVRQPWAWLIVNGHKQFENRDWQPNNPGRKFRGRVLIHASKGMTRDEYANAYATVWLLNDERPDKSLPGINLPPFDELERGGIVGETEIVAWHDQAPVSTLQGSARFLQRGRGGGVNRKQCQRMCDALNEAESALDVDLWKQPIGAAKKKRDESARGYASRPGSGPDGETCKTCKHLCRVRHAKTYLKCGLVKHAWTAGPKTDIRAKSPACQLWERGEE